MVSQAKVQSSKLNGKKGGVKTELGKSISRYNALKHGVLRQATTDYEKGWYTDILDELTEALSPVGAMENLIVERIAVHYIKLFRIQKAESEYIKNRLDPPESHIEGGLKIIPIGEPPRVVVDNEGYRPKLAQSDLEDLFSTYGRYETSEENKLYKALRELKGLQGYRKENKVGSFSKTS